MVVVAIVLALAFVATPLYQSTIKEKRRLQGESLLYEIRQKQEQFYGRNIAYTRDLSELGYDAEAGEYEQSFYTITVGNCPQDQGEACVALLATPKTAGDPAMKLDTISDEIKY